MNFPQALQFATKCPSSGGKAVFVARNLLNLEMEDELSSSMRVHPIKKTKNINPAKLNVFPNPASVNVRLEISNGDVPEKTEFFDIAGRQCLVHFGHDVIDLSELKDGFYLLKTESKGLFYFGNLILKR